MFRASCRLFCNAFAKTADRETRTVLGVTKSQLPACQVASASLTSEAAVTPSNITREPIVARQLAKDTVRYEVAALLRSLGGPGVKPGVGATLDPRTEAREAFDNYVAAFHKVLTRDPGVTDWETLHSELKYDSLLVPVACNTGAPGTGKTIQLRLLCEHVRGQGFIDIYFTLSGDDECYQPADEGKAVVVRVVRRILHGLVSHRASLASFLVEMKGVEQRCGVQLFDDALCEVMPMIIRDVCNASANVPILVAADGLRKWGDAPIVGKASNWAVAALKALGKLSQASAAAHVEGIVQGAATPTGLLYVVASTHSTVDPAKGLATESGRPLHFLPLPPLPTRFDTAFNAALKEAYATSQTELNKIEAVLRSSVFVTRHNARLLYRTARTLREETRPIDINSAIKHRTQVVDQLFARAKFAVQKLQVPSDASFIRRRTLLRTLLHRLPFEDDNNNFNPDLLSARRCAEVGIAALLRDFKTQTDAVCMNSQAIRVVLKDPFFDDPLTNGEEMLVDRLCAAMEDVPAERGEEGVGKLYEKVLGSAVALRVATLPKIEALTEAMTLYELISGRKPPVLQSPHIDPFFTTTKVLPSALPYVEAPRFCFPRAARCLPFAEAQEFQSELRKAGLKFTVQADRSLKGYYWVNCEFQNEPASPNPFFAHFAHSGNLVLDYGVLVDALVGNKKTKLLLGLQMKEHVGTDIANNFATHHHTKIQGMRNSTFPRHWSRMKKWLDTRGISDVVTVYVGPNHGSTVPTTELQSAQLEIEKHRDNASCIEPYFRHSCYMHHEHIRHWSPSVAYSGCDAGFSRADALHDPRSATTPAPTPKKKKNNNQ